MGEGWDDEIHDSLSEDSGGVVQAAIAEFCPKSCDAAAIDFGCGVGKYLPLLAEHTVRCLQPALHRTLHSVFCMHCIYTAYTLLIQCIHSTHTLFSANALHMYGTCRRVWWVSTSRVASSPSPARAVTPRGALHTACHVHSMVHCIAASMVYAMVRRCQRWVGGLVGWWVGGLVDVKTDRCIIVPPAPSL